MKLIWTKEALLQLAEIEEFIAKDNPKTAEKLINYLTEHNHYILQNPNIGRVVPEIKDSNIRELIVKKYRIVYRIKEDIIEILTIFAGYKLLNRSELDID